MCYDVRQTIDGAWEVFRVDTGELAKLGGVRMHGLAHEEALSALHMLTSRFQGTEREKQANRR